MADMETAGDGGVALTRPGKDGVGVEVGDLNLNLLVPGVLGTGVMMFV